MNNLDNIRDSLDGNLNRMMLTKDITELNAMLAWAMKRVNEIYLLKLNSIRLPFIKVRIVMQNQAPGIELDIHEGSLKLLEILADVNVPTDFYYEVIT